MQVSSVPSILIMSYLVPVCLAHNHASTHIVPLFLQAEAGQLRDSEVQRDGEVPR